MDWLKRLLASPIIYAVGAIMSAAWGALSALGFPSVQSEHDRVIYLLELFAVFVGFCAAAFLALYVENVRLKAPRLRICFEESYPHIQETQHKNSGAGYQLYRISVVNETKKTIDDVSVELSSISPGVLPTPLMLHQKDDNPLQGLHKTSFTLNPKRPQFIDVVQQQPGNSDFEIIHIVAGVSRQISRGESYRVNILASGRDCYAEREFSIFPDDNGRILFSPN